MKLEWNEAKRAETLKGRGLDFADVARFDWDSAIWEEDTRRDYGETRYTAFGFIEKTFVALAYTWRGNVLRVISLRRANARERKVYDQA